MTSALVALLQHLNIKHTDQVIPVRGEPYCDPTTKEWVVRYRREGVKGEFVVRAKVEFTPEFVSPNGLPGYMEKTE